MEENAAEKTRMMKYIGCPSCGQPRELELQMNRIEGNLYVWFEGLCSDCQHKLVDPMPLQVIQLNDSMKQMISN